MASMAHSWPENHVAMTAARAAELYSVSVHMYLGLVERLFNVRKGLRANSHPRFTVLPEVVPSTLRIYYVVPTAV